MLMTDPFWPVSDRLEINIKRAFAQSIDTLNLLIRWVIEKG